MCEIERDSGADFQCSSVASSPCREVPAAARPERRVQPVRRAFPHTTPSAPCTHPVCPTHAPRLPLARPCLSCRRTPSVLHMRRLSACAPVCPPCAGPASCPCLSSCVTVMELLGSSRRAVLTSLIVTSEGVAGCVNWFFLSPGPQPDSLYIAGQLFANRSH